MGLRAVAGAFALALLAAAQPSATVSDAALERLQRAAVALPASVNACPDAFDYFPNGGLASFYCHLKNELDIAGFEQLAGVRVYASGPHARGFAPGVAQDFGHYDPRFVAWLGAAATRVATDEHFRSATQVSYDSHIAPLARVWYVTWLRLQAHRSWYENEVARVRSALATKSLEERSYEKYYDFMEPGFFQGKEAEWYNDIAWDGNVVKTAVAYWVRRGIDGSALALAAALADVVSAYDPQFALLAGTTVELLDAGAGVKACNQAANKLASRGAVLARGMAQAARVGRSEVYAASGATAKAQAVAEILGLPRSAVQPLTWKSRGQVVVALGSSL